MFQGSTAAPQATARNSRSVASASRSRACTTSLRATASSAATVRLITREAIRADVAGTRRAIRSAASRRPSLANTDASDTLSTCRARAAASVVLM